VKSKRGARLTEADIDRLADRAEKGLDLSTWTPRRGRPSLDASAGEHSPRIAVRLPPSLHRGVTSRAAREGRNISEVVRDLLERYAAERLPAAPSPPERRT
jgi:predicted HicB family RNase H-like nuclease